MARYYIDYLAGFFDGEGCVSIQRRQGLRVIVTNTNLEILEGFKSHFGCGIIYTKKRTIADNLRSNYKPCFQWTAWAREAEEVLRQLLPHVRVKRKDIEFGLEFQETVLRAYSRGTRESGNKVNWERRNSIIQKMKEYRHAKTGA